MEASSSFGKAAAIELGHAKFVAAYDNLYKKLTTALKDFSHDEESAKSYSIGLWAGPGHTRRSLGVNIDLIEPLFRSAFQEFMKEADYPLAEKNFESLLREKSGDKFLRNDGTVNWFHEFLPILAFMERVRAGRDKNGIDYADVEKYGGMEVAICTHLRHDSVEDFTEEDEFQKELYGMRDAIARERPGYDQIRANNQIRQTQINVELMSQKVIDIVDGKKIKEDPKMYLYKMVSAENGNPVVYMLKQCDVNHNLATLLGAGKFDPARRRKRCNEREDMYAPRHGLTDIAIERWPEFSKGIQVMDCVMGAILFPHFRYLENVDLAYPDKIPTDIPVGTTRYMKKAMLPKLPEELHMVHIANKRMLLSVDPEQDPEKYARLTNFVEKVLMPPLQSNRDKFPYLFGKEGMDPKPAPAAVASPHNV